ncbi:MAG TPA: hypothetical protein PKI14_19660 [Fervidobacterium sp.]|nr:hypothetical protein [Fervidobacterium sp.]
MKYPISEYEETEFYLPDDEVVNHQQKIVKTRKPHKCCNCQKEIKTGENALRETGFMDGRPVSCYTCIECCDEWLDEINGIDEDGRLSDEEV